MKIEINDDVAKELAYMVKMHKEHGAGYEAETVEELVNYVLTCIADGSRRPGAWERDLLEKMGLVAETDEHHVYRGHYGENEAAE